MSEMKKVLLMVCISTVHADGNMTSCVWVSLKGKYNSRCHSPSKCYHMPPTAVLKPDTDRHRHRHSSTCSHSSNCVLYLVLDILRWSDRLYGRHVRSHRSR